MTANYDKIGDSIDRMQEAHYWIHMMEENYHRADQFRWYLNSFLKALKEVPKIIEMELQSEPEFPGWFKEQRSRLNEDPLIKAFSKNRDVVVHKGMLVPNSNASIGITEGRGMKLGVTLSANPFLDSEEIMDRYLRNLATNTDFLGILMPDEDSIPCVFRRWEIKGFEGDILDVCSKGWFQVVSTVATVLNWLGEESVPELSLDCRHSSQQVHYRLFDRSALIDAVEEYKLEHIRNCQNHHSA